MFVDEIALFFSNDVLTGLFAIGDGTTWSPSRQAKESDGIDRIPPPSQARSISKLVQAKIRWNSVGSKRLNDGSIRWLYVWRESGKEVASLIDGAVEGGIDSRLNALNFFIWESCNRFDILSHLLFTDVSPPAFASEMNDRRISLCSHGVKP